MKKLSGRRELILLPILYLVLLVLCSQLVNTHDDYYIPETGLGFVGSLQYAATMGNGRYLGNFFGNYLSQREGLNTFFRATVLFGIIYFVWALFGKGKSRTLALAALLFVFPGIGIFSQAYGWSHGFHNYAAPILLILAGLYLAKKESGPGIRAALLLLGCGQCLFSENTSVICLLIACLLLYFAMRRGQGSAANCLALLIGVLLGLFFCFLMPRITGVAQNMDWYRGVTVAGTVDDFGGADTSSLRSSISLIILKLVSIVETVMEWKLYWCGVGLVLLLLQRERRAKGQGIVLAAAAAVYCLLLWLTARKGDMVRFYSYVFLLTAALFLALLCVLVCRLSDGKRFFWAAAFLIAASLGELLFVAPIGQRCFYLPYAIAGCLQVSLWGELSLSPPRLSRAVDWGAWLAAAVLSLALIVIFRDVHAAYVRRTEWIEQQISQGKTEIEILELPHERFIYKANKSTMYHYTYGDHLTYRYVSEEEYGQSASETR